MKHTCVLASHEQYKLRSLRTHNLSLGRLDSESASDSTSSHSNHRDSDIAFESDMRLSEAVSDAL